MRTQQMKNEKTKEHPEQSRDMLLDYFRRSQCNDCLRTHCMNGGYPCRYYLGEENKKAARRRSTATHIAPQYKI